MIMMIAFALFLCMVACILRTMYVKRSGATKPNIALSNLAPLLETNTAMCAQNFKVLALACRMHYTQFEIFYIFM